MGKIKNLLQKLTFGDRTADAAAIPESGTGLFWFLLKDHYLMLILLNLVFLVCSVPVVTIPAAYSGLLAVLTKWARRVPGVEVFPTFFAEFKANFFGKLGVWLITTIAPFSLAAYVYFFTRNAVAFYAVLLLLALLMLLVQSYFFLQSVTLDIGTGAALKNAFLLLGAEWKVTLRLLCTVGLLFLVCVFATTYMLPVAVLCLFSLVALSVASEATAPVLNRLGE